MNIPKFPKIRLGLCCSNLTLRYNNEIYSSRRKNLKTLQTKGIKEGIETAKENLIDLLKMILWSKNHGIDVMRISSELVPHGNNIDLLKIAGREAEEYLSLKFLEPYLQIVGKVAKLEQIRLTYHPGQFVQIATPTESIFQASVRELVMHATFLDMMDMPMESVIVIHIGGTYCDKKQSIKRFISNFQKLPLSVKRRIVLENDEKCYNANDVLSICKKVSRPMVFDFHHYECYKKYHPEIKQMELDELIPEVLKTWKIKNIRPKFHLSEQMPNKPVGSHSLFINKIPQVFLDIPTKYNTEIDIMIEAKGKEIAISKLYQKYPTLKPQFRKELPKRIPIKALKDLKLPDEVKKLAECQCSK